MRAFHKCDKRCVKLKQKADVKDSRQLTDKPCAEAQGLSNYIKQKFLVKGMRGLRTAFRTNKGNFALCGGRFRAPP